MLASEMVKNGARESARMSARTYFSKSVRGASMPCTSRALETAENLRKSGVHVQLCSVRALGCEVSARALSIGSRAPHGSVHLHLAEANRSETHPLASIEKGRPPVNCANHRPRAEKLSVPVVEDIHSPAPQVILKGFCHGA
jgi:hypothetical protein